MTQQNVHKAPVQTQETCRQWGSRAQVAKGREHVDGGTVGSEGTGGSVVSTVVL